MTKPKARVAALAAFLLLGGAFASGASASGPAAEQEEPAAAATEQAQEQGVGAGVPLGCVVPEQLLKLAGLVGEVVLPGLDDGEPAAAEPASCPEGHAPLSELRLPAGLAGQVFAATAVTVVPAAEAPAEEPAPAAAPEEAPAEEPAPAAEPAEPAAETAPEGEAAEAEPAAEPEAAEAAGAPADDPARTLATASSPMQEDDEEFEWGQEGGEEESPIPPGDDGLGDAGFEDDELGFEDDPGDDLGFEDDVAGATLPDTGLPLGFLAFAGFLLTGAGLRLRRSG